MCLNWNIADDYMNDDDARRCIVELMCYNNKNCMNGGACREDFLSHSYKCDCPSNFTGDHCDTGE